MASQISVYVAPIIACQATMAEAISVAKELNDVMMRMHWLWEVQSYQTDA